MYHTVEPWQALETKILSERYVLRWVSDKMELIIEEYDGGEEAAIEENVLRMGDGEKKCSCFLTLWCRGYGYGSKGLM